MNNGPLSDIRIIEIEGIGPGPFCGMHFADLGADVILIERNTRQSNSEGIHTVGIMKRGKRSIVLDLKDPQDVVVALELISTADGLIEGMRPGVMERLGLGPDVCLSRNPRLVYGRVTGWGQTGPLSQAAGHDLNYVGVSSAAWYSSPAGQAPTPPPSLVGDIGGGAHYLMIGLLAGILNARKTGEGDIVDAAMVDGSAHMMNLLYELKPNKSMHNERGKSILDGSHWCRAYICADGLYISIACVEEKFYREFLRLMGLQNVPLFEDQFNTALWPKQAARLTEIFVTKTRAEWCTILEGTDACFGPILSPDEAPSHPHNVARGLFDQNAGYLQAKAAPRFQKSKTRDITTSPSRGEHTLQIIRELNSSKV